VRGRGRRRGRVALVLAAFGFTACQGGPGAGASPDPESDGAGYAPSGAREHARTVWAAAEDGATISPDGRSVAFVDWSSGDVAVRDLALGTTTRPTEGGMFSGSSGFPEPYIVFSPAGDCLVYPFGDTGAAAPFRYELRLVGIDGAGARVLAVYPPEVELVAPLDWHVDVGILLIVVGADASSELVVMDPEGGTPRVLERSSAESGVPRRALFTPDGRAVVYVANGVTRWLPSTGGASHELRLEADELLGFDADGRRLLFHGSRGDVAGNWSVVIEDGRALGEPALQEPTARGVVAAGRSPGRIAYLEPAALPGLFVVGLDVDLGRVVDEPRGVAAEEGFAAGNPSWSPDGTRLAFTLRSPNASVHRVMVSDGLGGPSRELARIDLRVMGLDWSDDGRYLVVGGRAHTRGSAWLGRIEVASGAVERLAFAPINAVAAGAGEEVVYVQAAPAGDRTVRVLLLPAPGQSPRLLASFTAAELPRSISVSPDGRWVALVKPVDGGAASALLLLPSDGSGEPRTLLRLERPDGLEVNLGTLPWTPDAKRVLVVLRRGGQRGLALVDVESGEVLEIPFAPAQGGRRQPALHPDGQRLVYVDGEERQELKVSSSAGGS
jgi:hypothetical protein